MGLYLRGKRWWLDCDWQNIPRIQRSTRTSNKTRAKAIERTLEALRDLGRFDLLTMIADGRLDVVEVHELWGRDRSALEQRAAKAKSPALGPLVDEFLESLRTPEAISPRTGRTYAPRTVERYGQSWSRFWNLLPRGRDSTLADLTPGFCSDYRGERKREGVSGATVNRDFVALSSFLRWCEEARGLTVPRFKLRKERESAGRERWLSAEEISALRRHTPPEWWPLFALLLHTGLRIGEAQGLTWADVRFSERRISVHERYGRRLKTSSSTREVPLSAELAQQLADHGAKVGMESTAPVFPGSLGDYRTARRTFQRATKAAKLYDVTLHDLRHTFGVHSAQAGVPLARIQKLMGHATPAMTMRYAAHAPESYFAEDAARVAASLSGVGNQARGEGTSAAVPALRLA